MRRCGKDIPTGSGQENKKRRMMSASVTDSAETEVIAAKSSCPA